MAYWLDDGFDTWPETIRAGAAAAGLYVRCGAWIARNLTDGHVPGEVAAMYGTTEWTRKLLDVGLWEAEGSGYRDVRYFAMGNPTAATVAARRKADADRKARWRAKKDASRRDSTRDTTRDNHRDETRESALPCPAASKEAGGAREQRGPQDNPDWRTQPAFGVPRDPSEVERARQRAAEVRANIRKPAATTTPRDAFAELVAATPPPPDETDEEQNVIPLRSA